MTDKEEEEARILRAYEERAAHVPTERYALDRPGSIQIRALVLEHVARALRADGMLPFGDRPILEVGCGEGQWLADFETMGANRDRLAGIDLQADRIAIARRRLCPGADLRVGSAAELPWGDDSFDVVLQSTVFTSILDDDLKRAVAAEMLRVVRPAGLILWYDFRFDNPMNADVRGIGKREIRRLFPGCSIELKRITVAPPLGRRIAPIAREALSLIERLRILNTHYLGRIRPR